MIKALKQLFKPSPFQDEAHSAYVTLVEQSRKAWFYSDAGVPDTVDGRFDVMVLHMFLLIHRLRREEGDTGEFIRTVCETFFSDMDRSLREMGSSDTGVGIRVKNMASAFYGRLQAYEQSLGKPDLLAESLQRNLFRGAAVDEARLQELVAYVQRNAASLEAQGAEDILSGKILFLS